MQPLNYSIQLLEIKDVLVQFSKLYFNSERAPLSVMWSEYSEFSWFKVCSETLYIKELFEPGTKGGKGRGLR